MHNPVRTITPSAFEVLKKAQQDAEVYMNPYVTPEHVLFQMEESGILRHSLEMASLSQVYFRERLGLFLSMLACDEHGQQLEVSSILGRALEAAADIAASDLCPVDIPHLLIGISEQADSLAGYLLRKNPEVINGFRVNSSS